MSDYFPANELQVFQDSFTTIHIQKDNDHGFAITII